MAAENDRSTLPFAAGWLLAICGFSLICTARPRFSLACGLGALFLSAGASAAKFKHMAMNAHVVDLYFYFVKPDTLLYLTQEFAPAVIAAGAVLAVTAALLACLYRSEASWAMGRRAGVALLLIGAGVAWIGFPAEADQMAYHVRKNHFATSFLASLSDAGRLTQKSALATRLAAMPVEKGLASDACPAGGPRPDIALVLSESGVSPNQMPEWRFGKVMPSTFKSFDGRVHGLRVETFGGATWISEVQLMAGLSTLDLEWRRPYATLFLEGKVRHSLPARLRACGYRTVAISPLTYNFVNEGPFLKSLGFDEVLDFQAIGAGSKHEPDDVYYAAALRRLDEHRARSDQPLFVFLLTMAGHSPYNYPFRPEVKVEGAPFGNGAEADEYLRRLQMGRIAHSVFLDGLNRRAGPRGIVAAEFGDHHPVITRPIIESKEGSAALSDPRSRAYETFFAVRTFGFPPAAQLPPYPVLDLTYLGLTVLETAGLPLGAVYEEQKALRDRCGGAFHTCVYREAVDLHLKRLVDGKLLELP